MPPQVNAGTETLEPRNGAPPALSGGYRIRWFPGFSALPEPYRGLLEADIKRVGLFREPEWFEHLMRYFFDDGDELRLYGVEEAGSGPSAGAKSSAPSATRRITPPRR